MIHSEILQVNPLCPLDQYMVVQLEDTAWDAPLAVRVSGK